VALRKLTTSGIVAAPRIQLAAKDNEIKNLKAKVGEHDYDPGLSGPLPLPSSVGG
jgi:hypothetical protein